MLTPGELEGLSMAFDKQMRTLESQIMTDIIRRIRINGEITRSADWQMHRLQQMGYAKSDIGDAIKKHLNLSDEDVEEMYKKIMEEGYARDTELYNKAGIDRIPFEENYTLQQSISAIALQTSNEMKNISQSLGFAVRNADGSLYFTPAAEYYQSTLDNAINGISQGVFDYNTAIKRVVSEMTNSGLRTVDYASGWSNRVDVAARRAVMTGFSQLTGKVNDMNAEEFGTDTFEVTWHSGARPSHQVWQGKWYTKDELVSVCGLGTVTGLHGANCYHDYYPVIPGISEPSYTAEELEELNRQDNTPVKYGDKEYTKYEALQRQRRLETTMRAQRQKIKLLKEGGANEDDIIAARARYRGTSAEYTRFSEAMKLPQQRQRVTVDGLGNIGQGKWKIRGDKMEAQFPKGYKDRRNVGEKISQESLELFAQKAESMNVKFATLKDKKYGGFEDYRGDPKILDEALEHIKNNQPLLTKITGDDKIILRYANVLGRNGQVDVNAFAMTKGRTITLNKFMYDDSSMLVDEYAKSVKSRHFTQGTDYKNIIDHELGHVFAHGNKKLTKKINFICEKRANDLGVTKSEYLVTYISKYSDDALEIIAEVNAMYNGSNKEFAKNILTEVGII